MSIEGAPIVLWELPKEPYWKERAYHAFATLPNASPAQKEASGDVMVMKTPNLEIIFVWVPDHNETTPDECRYFCHGWGLGTYNPHIRSIDKPGYTVLSTHVHKVLRDPALAVEIVPEAFAIGAENPKVSGFGADQIFGPNRVDVNNDPAYSNDWNIKPGHIIAWWGQNTQTPLIKRLSNPKSNLICMHTARIVKPEFEARRRGIFGDTFDWYLDRETKMSSKNGPQRFLPDTTLGDVMNVYKEFRLMGVYSLKQRPEAIPPSPPQAQAQTVQQAIEENETLLAEKTANGAVVPDERQI